MRKLLFAVALLPSLAMASPSVSVDDIEEAQNAARSACPAAVAKLRNGDEKGARFVIENLKLSVAQKYIVSILCASYLDGFSAR